MKNEDSISLNLHYHAVRELEEIHHRQRDVLIEEINELNEHIDNLQKEIEFLKGTILNFRT